MGRSIFFLSSLWRYNNVLSLFFSSSLFPSSFFLSHTVAACGAFVVCFCNNTTKTSATGLINQNESLWWEMAKE